MPLRSNTHFHIERTSTEKGFTLTGRKISGIMRYWYPRWQLPCCGTVLPIGAWYSATMMLSYTRPQAASKVTATRLLTVALDTGVALDGTTMRGMGLSALKQPPDVGEHSGPLDVSLPIQSECRS